MQTPVVGGLGRCRDAAPAPAVYVDEMAQLAAVAVVGRVRGGARRSAAVALAWARADAGMDLQYAALLALLIDIKAHNRSNRIGEPLEQPCMLANRHWFERVLS